jgi:hypothetical protein
MYKPYWYIYKWCYTLVYYNILFKIIIAFGSTACLRVNVFIRKISDANTINIENHHISTRDTDGILQ